MKYRLTFENSNGTIYSYVDDTYDEEYQPQVGEWFAPFPNVASADTTAYGLVEMIMQSDDCPQDFHEYPVIRVKVEKV